MSEQNPHITVRVESDDQYVPLEAFLAAVKGLKDLVAEVERTLGVDDAVKEWNVTGLQLGSAVLTISPKTLDAADAARRVRTIYDGIESVQKGSGGRPDGFSDAALKTLKSMGMVGSHYDGKVRVIVEDTLGRIKVDKASVDHIGDWLGAKRQATGSVEGTLEAVSIHKKWKFTVYDKSGHNVDCYFPHDLIDEVKQALGERICIRGKVKYRADGVPVSVQATRIKRFATNEPLPQIEDLIGIWDLGMTGDQYIRGLRDA